MMCYQDFHNKVKVMNVVTYIVSLVSRLTIEDKSPLFLLHSVDFLTTLFSYRTINGHSKRVIPTIGVR